MRKPYFAARLKCWYIKNSKRQEIRLDPDKAVAFELWHRMIAAGIDHGPKTTVPGLIDAFFDDLDGTVSGDRLKALQYYASAFAMDFETTIILTK